MNDRHLGQAEYDGDRRQSRDRETQQNGRAGVADRLATAHEQAGANGATQPDHHDLRARERLIQAALACLDHGVIDGFLHGDDYEAGERASRVQSQKGPVVVRLQAHNRVLRSSRGVNFSGVKPVPAWEPSQNGRR